MVTVTVCTELVGLPACALNASATGVTFSSGLVLTFSVTGTVTWLDAPGAFKVSVPVYTSAGKPAGLTDTAKLAGVVVDEGVPVRSQLILFAVLVTAGAMVKLNGLAPVLVTATLWGPGKACPT